jgi:hypothetical protein
MTGNLSLSVNLPKETDETFADVHAQSQDIRGACKISVQVGLLSSGLNFRMHKMRV